MHYNSMQEDNIFNILKTFVCNLNCKVLTRDLLGR